MAQMKVLGQQILKNKGIVAVRTDEIAELNTRIKDNEEAQADATEVRGKENAAWQAESEETKEALAAINLAMGVLMKATKPALLQSTAQLRASLSAVLEKAPAKALASMSSSKLTELRGFVSSLSQVSGKAGYAPQSMTIQGMLSDMYTTMGIDLMTSTADEAKKNRAFEDFMAVKDKELRRLKKTHEKKTREKVEAESMLAEATEAYDETGKQLAADTDFFDITKKACIEKTEEWQVRSKHRKAELEGVKQAIKILTSDDAKKLFAKSIKPGQETFLQLEATVVPHKSKDVDFDKMYETLKAKAAKSHSLRLASLVAEVRLAKAGHFDKVIKAIDKLIGELGEEQESDTKKRDECKEQYQDIAQESAKLKWKIKNNEATIKKLENLIKEREEEKKQTIKEIKKTQEEIKDMKKQRKKENEEFLEAKKRSRPLRRSRKP